MADAYAVIESDGKIGYTAMVDDSLPSSRGADAAKSFCHEHINDAVADGVDGAAQWVVRPITIGSFEVAGYAPRNWTLDMPVTISGIRHEHYSFPVFVEQSNHQTPRV